MIAIEIMQPDDTYRYFAYCAIMRSMGNKKIPIFMWNSRAKNIYDMYDEVHPEKVFYITDSSKDKLVKLNVPGWNFNKWFTNDILISDVYAYKKLEPDAGLICENICIAPFSDVDIYNEYFYKMMDVSNRYFRYFGHNIFGGYKDCGRLEINCHSMMLSSAKNIICLSKQFAVNAYLCNSNIVNYSISKEEVDACSSNNIVDSILDMEN